MTHVLPKPDNVQEETAARLTDVFENDNVPSEVSTRLLELIEFLERQKIFPISASDLARYASRCNCYAKAIHYRELEFQMYPSEDIVEELITLSQLLDQVCANSGP